MSEEKMGGGDVVKFADYLKRKATREAQPKTLAQQEGIQPLTSKQALIEARIIAAKFSSIRLLAKDIDRQQKKLAEKIADPERRKRAEIPRVDNLERARADYLQELKLARQLETNMLEGVVRNMFAGYNEQQTALFNSRYVAYARAYLEMVDKTHKLPNMEL